MGCCQIIKMGSGGCVGGFWNVLFASLFTST